MVGGRGVFYARPMLADAMTSPSPVVYRTSHELHHAYASMLVGLARANDVQAVAELGGGARPLLADQEAWGFAPTRMVFDISTEELDKADPSLHKHQADLCQPLPADRDEQYDLVFSKMLCEHLPDPETFHTNCFRILKPGGLSVHYFPTLYATPFIVNHLLPETLARKVVSVVQPKRLDNPLNDKFPAYYRWCHGPTERSRRRFEDLGFDIERWFAGFGHSYYDRVPPLAALERKKSALLVANPRPSLTAFAVLVLRKP